ncbi:MAG: DEAD/DEAH box helicase [Candidatus Symbiothrix sp.]|nr:DEAD/DEAH box helicase [Candidatus Symbiothrix sp.]
MQSSQIDFYNSLPEKEKQVLKLAALKASNISEYNLVNFTEIKTMKAVKNVLYIAAQRQLLRKEREWDEKYSASPDFMLYIFPQLADYKSVLSKFIDTIERYGSERDPLIQFRNCLYSLLHKPSDYLQYEIAYLLNLTEDKIIYYECLIQIKEYENYIHQINPHILELAIADILNEKYFALASLAETKQWLEHICRLSGNELGNIDAQISFFAGNFQEALEIISEKDIEQYCNVEAIAKATQSDPDSAFTLFEKALKERRKTIRNTMIPFMPHTIFYYLTVLLSIDSKLATPVFQKLTQWMVKKRDEIGFLEFFKIVIYQVLNDKQNRKQEEILLTTRLTISTESDMEILLIFFAYYLCGTNIHPVFAEKIFALSEKAYNSGFTILAFEAAYISKTCFKDDRSNELYEKIASELHYQPVLSRILHQDDWEKSLNLLLGLKTTAKKSKTDAENKTRVVYFFNPRNNNIQPVLQTRQVKGWTAGRNIALKSFFEGKAQGMFEQDYRIAKTLNHFSDYYNDYYAFSNNIYPQLVGHPYIFLEGSNNVPVEFTAVQPIIKIKKSTGGYVLISDLDATERIVVQKETNTRYKVYELTAQQQQIIQILSKQKITVPERGKEKLIELLGTFSAWGMSVHSDLLASESKQTEVKEIPADSRIRVQLLPFGDGLKAELFSKPFGEHPPYCKPGKGGKVLIANDKALQLQVKRNMKQEAENEAALLAKIQSLESLNISDGLLSFDDPLDSLYLLDILAKYPDISVVEWPEGERYKIRGVANFSNLHLNLKSGLSWFDLQGELKVDEKTVVSLQQLLTLTAKGHNRFIELSNGEFLTLSVELKKQLDELRLFSTQGKKEVKLNKFASVALDDFFDNVENLKADKSWKQFRERVTGLKTNDITIPNNLQTDLRAYQEDGFRWMMRLAEWEGGACLADDMGLGKTVQTLAVLLQRATEGPALVVCPVSVIGNWVSETARFAPTIQVKTLGSSATNRKELIETLDAGDLLITSYGLLQSEDELLSEREFATVVLDEAHAIKNYATKTSKASMQLKGAFRIALTGTPIQNHLGEIWNIFNFINPGLLGNLQHFTDTFIKPDDEKARKYLKKLIAPFILRRTKTAVLEELPPKTEIVKKVQLSNEEMGFYEALRRQALENLSNNDMNAGAKHLQVLAEITKLRQASCNPLLVDPNIQIPSSKLAAFLDIINELRENKHRALVFSQFVSHLSIVRQALDKQGIDYRYLDGSTPIAERERNVKRFQSGEGELFLISLKAGGLGLNLTAADFVIHLDPWWNPAVEDQASDRAHRIGQTRPVTIYRLVAENTIEEKIIQLHNTKRDLANSLLEGSDQSARLSLNELIALIKERG